MRAEGDESAEALRPVGNEYAIRFVSLVCSALVIS